MKNLNMRRWLLAAALAAMASLPAQALPAAEATAGPGVTVTAPWIRATVAQASATGVFMQIRSTRDARLLAVKSAAGRAEIHQMAMQGQTMTMRPVDGVDLPAGQVVNLSSGGLHVMLMDLKRQMKEGDSVPVTLVVQEKGKKPQDIAVKVPVKALTYLPPAP
jgi:copper(I)-binding protein